MPRMVRHVNGPSCLSGWRGMPSLEKQSIDLSRLCWQTEEPEGQECGSHQGNASGRWHHSFVLQSTPLSRLYMWRYMELTWRRKAGPYRHKRHHAISYPISGNPLYGLAQYLRDGKLKKPLHRLLHKCSTKNSKILAVYKATMYHVSLHLWDWPLDAR